MFFFSLFFVFARSSVSRKMEKQKYYFLVISLHVSRKIYNFSHKYYIFRRFVAFSSNKNKNYLYVFLNKSPLCYHYTMLTTKILTFLTEDSDNININVFCRNGFTWFFTSPFLLYFLCLRRTKTVLRNIGTCSDDFCTDYNLQLIGINEFC